MNKAPTFNAFMAKQIAILEETGKNGLQRHIAQHSTA